MKSFSLTLAQKSFLKRYRLVLASLTVGCACLFVLMYSNHVVKLEVGRRFHAQGSDLFSIINRYGNSSLGSAQIRRLDPRVLEVLKRDRSFILEVAPEYHRTEKVLYRDAEAEMSVIGVSASFRHVFDLNVQYGRFFTELDSAGDYCLVGNRLWKRWARGSSDSLIGQSVQIGKQVCRIIGVLSPSPTVSGEYRLDDALLMPYYTMMQFHTEKEFTKVTLAANPARNIAETADYIHGRLTQLAGDISAYEINNQTLFARKIAQSIKYISVIAGGLASMALLFGTWQLYLMMLLGKGHHAVSVNGKRDLLYYMSLALRIGLLTSLGGVMVGQGLAWLISALNGWVWQFALMPIVLTTLIAGLLTAFIGWRVHSRPAAI
jgi:ABC-type antimicrobial peptide transport system permease subunit